MRIGIDIDEVVVEFYRGFLKFFNFKFDKEIKFEDLKEYDFGKVSGFSGTEVLESIEEYYNSQEFLRLDLVENAKESINILYRTHKLFFITSRPREIKEKTINFLEKVFPSKEIEIFFSGEIWQDSKSKGEIGEALGLDLMIEDNFEWAIDCTKHGIKSFVMRKPWNESYKEKENLTKVSGWSEILEKIKEIKNEN